MLRVVHDFTSDASSLVTRGFEPAREQLTGCSPPKTKARGSKPSSPICWPSERLEEAGGKAMREHYLGNRAIYTINALESIGRYLSGVQSRKNVIWVSSGFPLVAFDYRGRSPTREINRATRSLNDGNVALYTVDARGLIPAFTGVPGKPVSDDAVDGSGEPGHPPQRLRTDGRPGLHQYQRHSGSDPARERRRPDDLRARLLPDRRRLGRPFPPPQLKMNRPGLEVRHRQGYFAVATEKQASSQRSAALKLPRSRARSTRAPSA